MATKLFGTSGLKMQQQQLNIPDSNAPSEWLLRYFKLKTYAHIMHIHIILIMQDF